jgi:Ni/Co efflux regulator RcnB
VNSWSFGDYLPGGWYSQSYYLNSGMYGLPYPPVGCEWVRVGDDALLVDVWSGQVLSVYYNLFW